jgi:CheY-like chemotaxis protein
LVRDHPAAPAPGDRVRISVADTGIGMDPAMLARATEPFFTTKPLGKGTGLGLSMVKDFCEQSDGAMTITTAPGAGTKVSLWLHAAMPETAPAPGTAGDAARADSGAAHVLLVDDDSAVRETLAAHLEESGFAVQTGAGGAEALALIEGGEQVDVLVCDLSMPGLNGVETIHRARALLPALPCILLTGYVGERAALSAAGAFSVVRKPVKGEVLARHIAASLDGRLEDPGPA